MACLAVLPGRAEESILDRLDRLRYPWPSFSVDVTLRSAKLRSQQWRVSVRENGDARVEGLSDKERGRTVLLLGSQMWLLLPDTKRPVKVSPQQRLLGPAAGGDIARFRFSGDYTLASARTETDGGTRLELQAARKALSYPRVTLWIDREERPTRAEFHFASGKLARTARYGPLAVERGARVLSNLDLEEAGGDQVRLEFAHWKPGRFEDHLFQLPPSEAPPVARTPESR